MADPDSMRVALRVAALERRAARAEKAVQLLLEIVRTTNETIGGTATVIDRVNGRLGLRALSQAEVEAAADAGAARVRAALDIKLAGVLADG